MANLMTASGQTGPYDDTQTSAAMEDAVMGSVYAANRVKLLGLAMTLLPLSPMGFIDAADAKITNIVIAKTTPVFEGSSFGAVGAYEQLDGTAYGEIDPRDPLNAIIQDLELAPRNARGMIEYSMDISILKP